MAVGGGQAEFGAIRSLNIVKLLQLSNTKALEQI